jgi:ketol-acid reductoisomerase
MKDWNNKDQKLLYWRKKTRNSNFEQSPKYQEKISEQEYYDHGILMVAIIKAGIELCFETMRNSGIMQESAYYESLHELPLIANTIARKRLHEMNLVISDTAEYGNYLFSESAYPILKNIVNPLKKSDLGSAQSNNKINNVELYDINNAIRNHPIEIIGRKLRKYMTKMKQLAIVE